MSTSQIAVIGLGYVGLPLAVALARQGAVTGYDHDPERIRELGEGRSVGGARGVPDDRRPCEAHGEPGGVTCPRQFVNRSDVAMSG